MTTEIPDAAVEAAEEAIYGLGIHELRGEGGARSVLGAALPHLRAAILGDLRERCEKASVTLSKASYETQDPPEVYRLSGKVEGVRLTISYIDDAKRMGQ